MGCWMLRCGEGGGEGGGRRTEHRQTDMWKSFVGVVFVVMSATRLKKAQCGE